jgi:hypothetical protein
LAGKVDEALVARQRVRPYMSGGSIGPRQYGGVPSAVAAVLSGRPDAIRPALQVNDDGEVDPTDRFFRAYALASLPSPSEEERARRTALVEGVGAGNQEANMRWLQLLAALSDGETDVLPLCDAAAAASARDAWGYDELISQTLKTLVERRVSPCASTFAQPFLAYQSERTRRESVGRLFSSAGDAIPATCVEFLAGQEPYTPWEMWALRMRARCYRKHQPERAGAAVTDIDRFLLGMVPPLGANVDPRQSDPKEDPDETTAATPKQ